MSTLLKSLLAVVLGLCAVLPVLGGDECGGGSGDSGVWILPRSAAICGYGPSVLSLSLSTARDHHLIADPTKGLGMQVSEEMGTTVGVLTAGSFVRQLAVDGHVVRLSSQLLSALRRANVLRAEILVSDGAQNGYVMTIVLDPRDITVYVF
jgi:hypothetical protein